MKINKKEILTALKNDMREAERMQREWYIKRAEWKAETNGQPYGNEVDGKSKIVSRDIKKQLEWMLPSITDPFLNNQNIINCNPVTFEDAEAARQSEILLNTQFCRRFHRYSFVMKAMKVLITEGSLVVQTGWDYEDEEQEVESEVVARDMYGNEMITTQTVKQTVIKKNQPTARVCRNEDIFIDPTCMDDMDTCQFVIHRYETSLSALRADGRYKNLDQVAQNDPSLRNDPLYYREDQTYFEFQDRARKKLVVHEYWGNYDIDDDGEVEPIVCAWVGDVIIRLETNPYPDKKPPFIIVPFNSVPFHMYGEALAETIGDNQKVKTAIVRGFIDNMAKSNNGQIGMRKGALDQVNRKKFLQGKNFEYNGTPNDFWQGSYNQLPGSAFDILTLMTNEIESQTGVKSFSGGINGGSLGGTATGARGALDAASTRRLNLVRNISENLFKPLFRKWLSYCMEFMEPEEVVRVTNEEYVTIRRDDLEGNIDIDMSISTAEDNAAKVQELSFLLQTIGPNEDPQIRRDIMADIYELSRMPEEAKRIRDYQPQPDPMQQQMQELQLAKLQKEIELLDADIQDKMARAGENTIDAQVKQAKAQVEMAKARKLGSEADKLDLDFLLKDSGYADPAAKIENDRLAKMDQLAFTHLLDQQKKKQDRDNQKEDMLFKQSMKDNEIASQREHDSVEAEKQRQHDRMMVAAQLSAKDRQIGLPRK